MSTMLCPRRGGVVTVFLALSVVAVSCAEGGGGDGGSGPTVAVPATPTSVQAQVLSATSIRIRWTDVANETGYTIEYTIPPAITFQTAGTASTNTMRFDHTGLIASTTYVYRVKAINSAGSSPPSLEANAITSSVPTAVPEDPTGLTAAAVPSTLQIDLAWVDASTDEDGFRIERRKQGGIFIQIATVGASTSSYQDMGLEASTAYIYRVRSYNAIGDSAYSNEVTDTTASAPLVSTHTPTDYVESWFRDGGGSAGLFGEAMYFPGDGTYITKTGPQPSSAITVCVWIKASDWNGNRRIVQKGIDFPTDQGSYRLLAHNGVLEWSLGTLGSVTTTLPSTNRWYHVAGTYDASYIRLYVNGSLMVDKLATGKLRPSVEPLYISQKFPNSVSSDSFSGYMDELVIYDRSLSSSEIANIWYEGKGLAGW